MNWKRVRLEAVCTKITDGTHKTPKYVESGIHFLSAKNINNGHLDVTNCKFITSEEHKELKKRCFPEAGDVMLSKSGSLGAAVIVPTLNFEFSIFESLALLKVDRSKVVPEFLQQVISSPQSKRYFHSITTGLAVKHLHLVDLRKMRLVLPPIQEQTAIAGLLSTWDKAIEKTERLVQAKKRSFLWLQEQLISSKNSAAKGWKEFHLGDVSEVIKKTPIDSVEGKTLLTVKLHCLGVESNTRVKPKPCSCIKLAHEANKTS